MGFFYPGLPPYLVAWGSTTLPDSTVAVETGTFLGDSAEVLATAFGRCVTIEKSPELARQAQRRFQKRSEISVVPGSSRDHLPVVLTGLGSPPFVWLDAHWSGGNTAGADDPCPVLAEIAALAACFPGQAVVLIDDARIFGVADPDDNPNAHWPGLRVVLTALHDAGWVTFVIDDVIAGIPARHAASFAKLADTSMTTRTQTLSEAVRAGVQAEHPYLRAWTALVHRATNRPRR